MKTAVISLWLVMYPACGDAIYDFVTGPFASIEVCEEYKKLVTKRTGPPSPGSQYVCGIKP